MVNDNFKFVISRTFQASRARVWEAWTKADQLQRWFGPKDCPIFHNTLDLKKGGVYHYGMKTADGGEMWGKWIFLEVNKPERLVFIVAFSEASGIRITRNPWNETGP